MPARKKKKKHPAIGSIALVARCLLLPWLASLMLLPNLHADTIILRSGEEFVSSEIWEEQGKVRFNLQGLIVSVDPREVAAIHRQGQAPVAPGTETQPSHAQATRTLPEPQANASLPPTGPAAPTPAEQPVSALPAADPSPQPPLRRKPRAQGDSALVRDTGLTAVRWHMPPEQIAGLVKIKTEPDVGGLDHYAPTGETPQLGGVLLDGINYIFWRSRLYSIVYWVEGKAGYGRLKSVVQAHYGMGTRNANGLERYIWRDPDTDRLLEFDTALNTGIFWMRSRVLDDRIRELYPE